MKRIILILLVLFLAGCEDGVVEKESFEVSDIKKVPNIDINLLTEKELYHSNEMMKIDIEIHSDTLINDAKIIVYGIYSQRNRLNKVRTMDIIPGKNNLTIEYLTPQCTGCAGINPGSYSINVELNDNDTFLSNASNDVEIKQ